MWSTVRCSRGTPMSLPPSSAPSVGFVCFAEWLHLSECQAERLHAALVACGDRQARSTLFALERFSQRRSQSGMLRDLARFGLGIGSPRNLIALVEKLVEGGLLTRKMGSAIEEALLSKTGAHGQYR